MTISFSTSSMADLEAARMTIDVLLECLTGVKSTIAPSAAEPKLTPEKVEAAVKKQEAASGVTKEATRSAIIDLMDKKGREAADKVLASCGVTKLKDATEDQLAAIYKAATAALGVA